MKLSEADIAPKEVWEQFETVCSIPHPSGHEKELGDYIMQFCEARNVQAKRDEVGNISINLPGTPGLEAQKRIILQCHLDMVPQKNAYKQHDFIKDPIIPIVENGWVRADDTTLGADNGLAVAAVLAIIADQTIPHAPLNILLTVEEETRMLGAEKVSSDFFDGDYMINLDSEEIDEICIACAGGTETSAFLKYETEPVPDAEFAFFDLTIAGLEGGHSGVDIILGRANAIKILGEILGELAKSCEIRICNLHGGSLWNAIPREASVKVAVQESNIKKLKELFSALKDKISERVSSTDPNISLDLKKATPEASFFSENTQQAVIDAINSCPDGVIKMSESMPGIVETSTNLGILKLEDAKIAICTMQRSMIDEECLALQTRMSELFEKLGFSVKKGRSYPGWRPVTDSEILKKSIESYKKILGEEPKIHAIHAGLECGLIGSKKPGLEMISIGPTMKYPHSPKEKVNIESVEKFWKLLLDIIS